MMENVLKQLGKKMKTNLVIFDLDGVLIDACEWHRLALNEALKEICNYEISIEDHHNTYNGIPTKVKLQQLSEKGIVSYGLHNEIFMLKQEKTISLIDKHAKKNQEKIELMQYLKNKNILLACFTNSIQETAYLMLKKTGIYDMFEMIVTNEDVTVPKPNPEGYIKVLNSLNISYDNAIIVEDSPKGKKAAYASGCHVLEVVNAKEVNIDLFKGVIE